MIIKDIVKMIETIPIKIISFFPHKDKCMYHYVLQQVKELEKHCDMFCSLYCRPKYASQVISVEQETEIHQRTAIIMQGPLIAKDDFTIETVKIYGKLYPGVIVIVSTWTNESSVIIERLKMLKNCEVVLSKLPEHSGMLNLNYQITSTIAGIKKAKELKRDFIFKTRCDFRFVKNGLIQSFAVLLEKFPIDETVLYQKSRIIVGGDVFASYFRAFWVADRFSFGLVDDMYTYWNYEMDEIDSPKDVVKESLERHPRTWREVTEAGLCAEPRILLNYLKRMEGTEPECSVKNFWNVLKKQFITVSVEETGAYWMKGGLDETGWKGIYYREKDNVDRCLCYNWDFTKWLALYAGKLSYKSEYERIQERNIGFD